MEVNRTEIMSYNNRDLVEFFILKYKLSQGNYTNRNKSGLLEPSRPQRTGFSAVKAALRDSAQEFELHFTQVFSDLSLQLDITPDTAYHSFKSVMDEVFKDGINWGRIVALFAFGGVLCVECVEKNMRELVPHIIDWMTLYLDEHINPWIQSNGGWDHFAKIFGKTEASRQEKLWKWLIVGLGVLTGVVVSALFIKKLHCKFFQ